MTAPIETPSAVHVVNAERISPRQVHYRLSSPVAATVIATDFVTEDVVVSVGRHGDTQIFPATAEGAIVDLLSLWGRDYPVPHDEAIAEWLEGQAP